MDNEKKDYKKLYKDIVASDWFKRAYFNKSLGECPFDIPELRDSDDERIRKMLVEQMKNWRRMAAENCVSEDIKDANAALDWLENHTYPNHLIEDFLLYVLSYGKGGWGEEKQKEQKPISQEDFDTAKHEALWGEQKPRKFKLGDKVHWYDDNTNVITITGFRDDAYLTDSAYGLILYCDEDYWERVEQKPAEWSEEDEKYLNLAINIVSSDFGEDSPTVSWLKSLRPQPHWKPSEEQIEAVYNILHPDDPYYDELKSLYEQLKRL